VLREGNPNGIIGFEARIDPDDTYHHLDTFRTIANYDFAASWYYPYQGVPLTHVAPLLEAREAVRELALQLQAVAEWGRRPVFFEQIGAAMREENLDHQRLFLISATELLLTESLGYGIWAWQDYTLNSVYNPGFELGIDRWHAEGDVLDVDRSSHVFHGQRAVQLRPGGLIRQDMAGYGGRFCSLYARAEQLEKATLLVAIERLQDGRVTDRQERVLQISPTYEQQVKQRQDSIEQFTKGGRMDLAEKEKAERNILNSYLPAEISDDELRGFIQAAIQSSQATSIKDMGKVMKDLLPKVSGKADNKRVSDLVKDILSKI
jgi:uncharacterized protein YqeY